MSSASHAARPGDPAGTDAPSSPLDGTDRPPSHDRPPTYDRAFEDSAIGMAIEDLDGRFLAVNPALCELVGYPRAQLLRMTYMDICHPDDVESSDHLAGLADGTIPTYVRELRYIRSDGEVIWVRVHVGTVKDGAGRIVNHAVQIEDVTSRREAEARLAHQADHDALTGLPNRHALTRHLAALGDSAGSGRDGFAALLFVDLDRFKLVNDSLGHTVGDELLLAVAGRLRHTVAAGDLVARIGGDEFVVLTASVGGIADAEALAARLQRAVAEPFGLTGRTLHVTVSIGVAVAAPGDPPGRLLRAADLAMHGAKVRGKARAVLFDPSMVEEAERRLATEQGLHRAVEAGELACWYQPIVSLVTGRVVAAEALVRWHHPEAGVLEPSQFLPVAEETGLSVPIGRYVLGRALDQAMAWRATGAGLIVNVNLASAQLEAPGLVGEVLDALRSRSLVPSDLCLEVSESALLVPDSRAARTVTDLRRAGVLVAVDDFGRGHSSLAYLRSHPVDVVKIDREFVTTLGSNPRDAAIVGAVVALTHALGMTCIAEGVESRAELARLAELGCDQIQGYLLGRPTSADDFAAHLGAEAVESGRRRLAGWLGRRLEGG